MKRYIYKLICLINNKFYVGQTHDLDARFERHMTYETHPELWIDIQKYGRENFKLLILDTIEDESLKIQHYNKDGKPAPYKQYASNVSERTFNRYYSHTQPLLIYNKDDNRFIWRPLKQHKKPCPICDREISCGNLQLHIDTQHLGIKNTEQCPHCDRKISRSFGNLQRHINTQHLSVV
jgi:hypothetical protein